MHKRKIRILAAGLMVSLLAGAGCGKKAADGIVSKKETTEAVMDIEPKETTAGDTEAFAQAEAETEVSEKRKNLKDSLGVPEVLFTEVGGDYGSMITTNAEVTLPDEDTFYQVEAAQVEAMEEMLKLAEPLLGEGGLYEREEAVGQEIHDYNESLSRISDTLARSSAVDESGREMLKGQYDWIKEKRDQAVKDAKRIPKAHEFITEEKMEDSGVYITYLVGLTDWERGPMRLSVAKYGFSLYPENTSEINSCTIPEEEAEVIAEQYMENIAIADDYALIGTTYYDGMSSECEYYEVWFGRKFGNASVNHTEHPGLLGDSMLIQVDDEGVRAVAYNGSFALGESEETGLLPFEEILKSYQENAYLLKDANELEEADITGIQVSDVKLGYAWMEESEDDGYFVPAWTFYGTLDWDYDEEHEVKVALSEREVEEVGGRYRDLLTINAIDGTVIHR